MDSVAKVGKQLMLIEPFYGFFLLNLNKQFSNSLPTAGVGRDGINQMLWINPQFWESLSDDHKLGLLKHELLHIVFTHLTMRNSFSDKKLFNIAADCELNQYIDVKYLPDGAILPSSFETLTLDLKAGTNYYYKKLLENQNSNNPDPTLSNLMNNQQGKDGNGNSNDMHPTWKDFDQLSDVEKKLIQNQVEHILKETAKTITKSRGTIPGELKEYVDSLFEVKEKVFDWKSYFRRMLGTSNETYTKKTRKRPSVRFPDSAGIRTKQKHHILYAKDTSGSVSIEELHEAESELNHIYKAGASITVMECDTKINRIYEYKGKFADCFMGRGGTDFKPVIDYFNANKQRFTTLVFFTDGGAPINCKPHKPMIWLISSSGSYTEEFPGKIIKIPSKK